MTVKIAHPLASIWGVVGVMASLSSGIYRVSVQVAPLVDWSFTPFMIALSVGWLFFMVYVEGYKGFHLKFAPRVVQRAFGIPNKPILILFAPLICMGYFYATKKRRIVSTSITVGIIFLVMAVKQIPQPWRGILDLGVIAGLSIGVLSVGYHSIRSLMGNLPGVDPEFPPQAT